MTARENQTIRICPHCGAENRLAPNAWTAYLEEEVLPECSHCKQDLMDTPGHGEPDAEPTGSRYFLIKLLIIAALLGGLFLGLNHTFGALDLKKDWGQVGYLILLVAIISPALASGKLMRKFKYLAIWTGIFCMLLLGYSYRHELQGVKEKVMAELIPMKGYSKAPASMSFPISSDGHFYIRAMVNDTPIIFLADTGASHIVISPNDAVKLGFAPGRLTFDRFYETANGTVRGSSIKLSGFRVGELEINNIGASVNEAAMSHSLLGMTFFKRLEKYEVKNEVLTLYW